MQLAGVQVLFDGRPVPLLYAQSTQINAVVPWLIDMDHSVPYGGQTQVTVQVNGVFTNSFSNPVTTSAPGVFIADFSSKQAAVLNQDGTPNSLSNPAKAGSIVAIFGTGGGPVYPPGITGGIWPADPLSQLIIPPQVLIAGQVVTVVYAGSAPGLLSSVFQINVRVPQDLGGVKAAPYGVMIVPNLQMLPASGPALPTIAVQ